MTPQPHDLVCPAADPSPKTPDDLGCHPIYPGLASPAQARLFHPLQRRPQTKVPQRFDACAHEPVCFLTLLFTLHTRPSPVFARTSECVVQSRPNCSFASARAFPVHPLTRPLEVAATDDLLLHAENVDLPDIHAGSCFLPWRANLKPRASFMNTNNDLRASQRRHDQPLTARVTPISKSHPISSTSSSIISPHNVHPLRSSFSEKRRFAHASYSTYECRIAPYSDHYLVTTRRRGHASSSSTGIRNTSYRQSITA
jgi:hypothetical protein